MTFEPIEFPGGRLRSLQADDAPVIAQLANNPKIPRHMRNAFPSPYTLQDAEDFIAIATVDNAPEWHFAIETEDSVAGVIGLTPGLEHDVHCRTAEIGYWLGEPYWGRGLASAAVNALVEAAFERSWILRVFATVYDGNPASCRVLEKAGFQREGVQRANVEKHGRILDTHLYARIHPSVC